MKKKKLKYLIKANIKLTASQRKDISDIVNDFKSGKHDTLVFDRDFSILVINKDDEIVFGDENGILKGGDDI